MGLISDHRFNNNGASSGNCQTCGEGIMEHGGKIFYECGHIWVDDDIPYDADWKSEVFCPACTGQERSDR